MSQATTRHFAFTWKIENFSYCPLQENERLTAPIFAVDTWKNRSLQIWFYPRGWKKPKYLACYVFICDAKNWKNTNIESFFKIKGSDTCSIKSKRMKFAPGELGPFGDNQIVTRDEIFQNSEIYLPNDTLTIQYHILINEREKKTRTANFDFANENILADQILMSTSMHELEVLKNNLNSKQCSLVTNIIVGKKSFVWPIKGIRELGSNKISIPVLPVLTGEPSFVLTFHLDDEDNKSNEGNEYSMNSTANLEIRRTKCDFSKNLFMKCKISALNSDNGITFLKEEVHLFKKNAETEVWSFASHIHEYELQKYLDSNDGVLDLRCEFTYSLEGNVYHTGNEESVPPTRLLIMDNPTDNQMMDLYKSGDFSDVTFRVGDGSFKAHKNILSTRSPVFQAMFENDMKENNTGFVDVTDIDPDTMDKFLIFLYSNNFTVHGSNEAIQLYAAADKYQAHQLKHVCLMYLQTVLSVSNVCSILSLADLYQEDKLMEAAKEFLYSNRSEALATENWKTFMETNTKLSSSIMFQLLRGEKFFLK